MKDFLVMAVDAKLAPVPFYVHAEDADGAKDTAVRWLRAKGIGADVLSAHALGSLTELTQGFSEIEAEGGCPFCEGRGVVSDPDEGPEAEMPCDECGGSGKAKGGE